MTEHRPPTRLVDWRRTARRMRASVVIVGLGILVGWGLSALLGLGVGLGAWVGLGLGCTFVVEVVVVGGSALRGMLRAGERGERLAGGDVGLLPSRRRRAGRRDVP